MLRVYRSLTEVEADDSVVGYVRVLQRAWKEFHLASVMCVDNVPTLYRVDESNVLGPEELRSCHRRFWSQGVASVLMVVDAKSVYLFSGLQPPSRATDSLLDVDDDSRLDEHLTLANLSQREADLHEAIANGAFYRRYCDRFKSSNTVDQHLARNLYELCRRLIKGSRTAQGLDPVTAHNFICRLLFACYLVDRGICPLPDGSKQRLSAALVGRNDTDARDFLYQFLASLKRVFNGSMFEQDLEAEKQQLTPAHMAVVAGFLRGDDLRTSQGSLGFWAYDFKLIPVETISGIYERFLDGEDKRATGAYYTPRFLTEMAVDIATEGDESWPNRSYLDPCCGSGVFLVTLFNRLVTRWEIANPEATTDREREYLRKHEALRGILRTQLHGMDSNLSACVLTCFSLYVAFLDSFDPSDIRTYIERTGHNRLPKLLVRKGESIPGGDNTIPVVFEDDTLTTTKFDDRRVDVVIGNPPWGGEGGRGSRDPALSFLRRADDLVGADGKVCLLLPSRIFLNLRNDSIHAKWLADHTLERVVQLADFRYFLFPGAICPCMAIRFRRGAPVDPRHAILFDTPKFDASSHRQGLVVITEADRKPIPQAQLAYLADDKRQQAHTLWKRLFWGTERDRRFLEHLDQYPKLSDRAGTAKSRKPWKKGQGIQPDTKGNCRQPMPPWWPKAYPFIKADAVGLDSGCFLFKEDTETVGDRFPRLFFSREDNQAIFTPPLVLVSQGFGKVVFCDFPVLYRHALQGIHATDAADEDLLLFLTAYLKSDLARYYCFHTSSTLGIERGVVRQEEYLDLPFPLPEEAPARNARQIVEEVARLLRTERERLAHLPSRQSAPAKWLEARSRSSERLRDRMREYVYQYFDIQPAERWLVEDTVHVFEPSATPTSPDSTDVPTLQPVVPGCSVPLYAEGLKAYADALTTTLNAWAAEQESDWRVSARGGVDEATGLAMVRLDYTRCVSEFRPARFNSKAWQDLRNRFAEQQVAVRHEHQIIGFLGNEFYIVRPMTLMHWTRTAALNDADTFFWREQAEPNAGVLCMQQARKVQLQGADRAAAGGARETSRARGVARQRQESEASGGDAWEAGE